MMSTFSTFPGPAASATGHQPQLAALTVRQPWATLIIHGGKDVENRTWRPPAGQLGQPLLVHAASKPAPASDWVAAEQLAGRPLAADDRDLFPYGVILGVVTVTGHHPGHHDGEPLCSRWASHDPAAVHWTLTDARPIASPVPCRGALGLWRPATQLHTAAVAALLPERAGR